MKIFFNKYLSWLIFFVWGLLAAITGIQLNKVLAYHCFFLNNWPFCSASISTIDQVVQIGLLIGVITFFAWFSYQLYHQFFLKITTIDWSLVVWPSLIAAVLILPFGSSDFQYYFGLGQAVHDGVNPYTSSFLVQHPFLFVEPGIDYSFALTTMYGPIVVSLLAFIVQFSFDSLILFTVYWKFLMLGVFLFIGLWFKNKFFNHKLSLFFWPFWLLQPLILWEWLANGHFDGLWLIFVLWAVILAKRGLWWAVVIVLTIALWIKLVPILFLPWFCLWWWQGLNKNNWLKQCSLMMVGLLVGGLVSVLVWLPYWQGFKVFQPLILQSKWVVNSLFGFIYYGLEPVAWLIWGSAAHFWLTRLVHGLLFLISLYFLWPYAKKVWLLIIKKITWQPADYYQAMFISLLVFISIWQKSFWPWYMIWLLPFGWLVLNESVNGHLLKAVRWLSWSPLLFYVINLAAGGDLWNIWFFLFIVVVIIGYPLWQIYQWRKVNYVRE